MNSIPEQPDDASDEPERVFSVFCDLPLFVDGNLHHKGREKYLDNTLEAFGKSEWATEQDEQNEWAVHAFLDLGLTHLAVSVDSMTLDDAMEVLMDLFPRKVSAAVDQAGEIIDTLVRFWTFCDRTHHFKEAASIAENIAASRDEFYDAMDDTLSYDPSKSFYMAGVKAGYDMTSEVGINAFMLQYNMARMAAKADRYDEPEESSRQSAIPKDLKQRKKLLKKLKRR
jgi:hypothetical protein